MKKNKILIVSASFAPELSSHSIRVTKIVKYLLKHNWDVTVVTAKKLSSLKYKLVFNDESLKIIKIVDPNPGYIISQFIKQILVKKVISPNTFSISLAQPLKLTQKNKTFVNKIKTLFWLFFSWPDRGIWWLPFGLIYVLINNIFNRNSLIITMGGFFSVHLVGYVIKKIFGMKWIASFDDPWECGYYISLFPIDFEIKIKKKILSSADAFVCVNNGEAKVLHSIFNKPIFIMPHGYDKDDYNEVSYYTNTKFSIVYTGVLYDFRRNPFDFFSAISELKKEGIINKNNFEVKFIGSDSYLLIDIINKFDLKDLIFLSETLPHNEVTKLQQKATVLLLIGSGGVDRTCPLKLGEYIGAKKPILYISPKKYGDDIPADIISKNSFGVMVKSKEEIKNILKEWVIKWQKKVNFFDFNQDNAKGFSYDVIVDRFSNFLKDIIDENRN